MPTLKDIHIGKSHEAIAQGKTCQRVRLCNHQPNEDIRPTTRYKK